MVQSSKKDDDSIEEPCHRDVATSHTRADHNWQEVGEDVLYRMAVNGAHTHWGNPIVV